MTQHHFTLIYLKGFINKYLGYLYFQGRVVTEAQLSLCILLKQKIPCRKLGLPSLLGSALIKL